MTVLLPLAIFRVVLLLWISAGILLTIFVCPPALQHHTLSVLGRGVLFCFGIWPGLLSVHGERRFSSVSGPSLPSHFRQASTASTA